jgi:uncharacterized protein
VLVSIIVPVLDEREALPVCLAALAGEAPPLEILVADGGSRDGTRELALSAGVRLLDAPRGRARQMNAAAAAARGEALWFLHADSVPPPGAVDAIRSALRDPRVAGGAFRLALTGRRAGYRVVEWGANLRTRLFGLPYGDQGLFTRRGTFDAVGGYGDVPLFEDVYFVRALRRRGRLAIIGRPLGTSPRRWERGGLFRTSAMNAALLVAERLGAGPTTLARWRYGTRAGRDAAAPSAGRIAP